MLNTVAKIPLIIRWPEFLFTQLQLSKILIIDLSCLEKMLAPCSILFYITTNMRGYISRLKLYEV